MAQQMPTIIYQGHEPTITAMQVRKEKEAELQANDEYWAKRLQSQEADFLKNSKIMEKEFTETVSFSLQLGFCVTFAFLLGKVFVGLQIS